MTRRHSSLFLPGCGCSLTYGLLLISVVLVCLLLGSVAAFELIYADRIYPGVWIWNVDVGGMPVEEAAEVLDRSLEFDVPLVVLRRGEQVWPVRPVDLGFRVDPIASLAPAYRIGRDGSWVDNLVTHGQLLIESVNLPPIFVYDTRVPREYLYTLARQIDQPPTDANLALDGFKPVASAARVGHQLDVETTLTALLPAVPELKPVEVTLVVDEIPPAIVDAEAARSQLEALLAEPLTLVLADPREEDPGPWVVPPEDILTLLGVYASDGALEVRLHEEAVRSYLLAIAPALVIEPVDARFHFNEVTRKLEPIQPSEDGRALDVEASAARIVQGLTAGNRQVSLVLKTVPPRYPDTATAEELGIITKVAEGDSYFIGSPSGRDHNIRLAAKQFDGIVVAPGDTFSFNHYLGEVSAEAGYDESYVTAGEELAIEVGGGICQVSTTAFRAAFWGGYPIVERWYHNHRIGYYELRGAGLGMDATVYSPHVDFRFTNDRAYPLLIETEIVDASHRLVFRFYSTDDGRQVEKEDPVITDEAKPGPPIYQLDEDLAPGKVTRWQSAVNGLTATVVRKVYAEDGSPILNDTFVSRYAPRRASYRYGPGYEPPVESDPETEDS
jgi:vancomycin resistance protein YoaR